MAMNFNRWRESTLEEVEGVNVVSKLLHCSARVRDAVFFVPGPEFAHNPYSLQVTSDRVRCHSSSEHWMLYPGGFLHVSADGISEKLNAWEWVREARVYAQLVKLNFFRTLRLRKAFCAWLSSARANAFGRSRRRLGESLRFQAPYMSVLTTGLAELRLALDSLRVTPANLPEGRFTAGALAATGRELTEVAARQARLAIHLLLEHVHQLCRQLVTDLNRAWRHLHQERCPSTYDSPVLGLARGRVAHLRSRVARCRRLESLLPVFLRLLAYLVLDHAAASLLNLLEPLRSRLSDSRTPLLLVELQVAGGPTSAGGEETAGPPQHQLLARPDRTQSETRLRELARGAACALKLGAERALQPRLESWARHQPDTFRSAQADQRVHAGEVRFIHALRDASWGSIEQQTSLLTLLSNAMAQDFTIINTFIEKNAWILEVFRHCGVDMLEQIKPPARLTSLLVEFNQLIIWHDQLETLPPHLCAGLLQVSLSSVHHQLTERVQRRASQLLVRVIEAVDQVRTDMQKVMREIPAEFSNEDVRLSRWYYRVTGLIRDTWRCFEPVGTALRCLTLLRRVRWQEGFGTAELLGRLELVNQQLTADWSIYMSTLYSRHNSLLAGLDKRIPDAHRFHEQALDAAESVRRHADKLPRWLGPSDVIMKAMIPGFDADMAKRLDRRISQFLGDVVQLTQLMTQLNHVMEEVDEAERVIRLLFHHTVESRQARRTYRRVSEKVAVWTSLRDLLALARVWLRDMRNGELRTLLTSDMNAWQHQRRHFISDVSAERQSVRFWRDRVEEVRRLVVMMEAVQGEGTGGDNWSPIVGRMRYLMAKGGWAADGAIPGSDAIDNEATVEQREHEKEQEQQTMGEENGKKSVVQRQNEDGTDTNEKGKLHQREAPEENKQQETLTRHVSVIYEQVSRSQKSFSAKELVETMNAKLETMTFTVQRYVPDFIAVDNVLMDEAVYMISDGTNFETEVMFQMSALRAVTDWNLTSVWWRTVLATNERWERAAMLVRRLVSLQRLWMRLHRLVATGVAEAPPAFARLSATYRGLTSMLQRNPRLCSHDFSQMLSELRAADSVVCECLSMAGPGVEVMVRGQQCLGEGQGVPAVLDGDMEWQLRVQAEQEGLVLSSGHLSWLVALHRQLTQSRVAVVTGESGAGKSTLLSLLTAAKQQILAGSVDDVYLSNGATRVIERVLVGPRPLEWLVSSARLMGTLPMVEEWLIIDHDWPVLDELLTALTPVVEQNHNLVLVLEMTKLDQFGPSDRHAPFFSLSPHKLSWRMLVSAWFQKVAKTTLYRYELDTLKRLTEQLFPGMLVFLSQHHTTLTRNCPAEYLVSGFLGCHQVAMFQQLFTALMAGYDTLLIRDTSDTRRVLRRVAALAFVWAFGGALEQRHRTMFAETARHLMAAAELDFPSDGCVLEHALDTRANWCHWPTVSGGHVTTRGRQWHVPVPQQGSVTTLAARLLRCGVHVLLLGPRGAGKTQLLRHEIAPRFQDVSLDHAPYASAVAARRYLQTLCRRARTPIPRPAVVIDDLHYATDEPGGAGLQHLLREHFRLHGFRSGPDFEFRSTGVMAVFATAVDVPQPVVVEHDDLAAVAIDNRLRRQCFVLTLPAPDATLVAAVFGPVVQRGVWKYLPSDVAGVEALFTHCWMDATCRLFLWLQAELPASAARPGRAFSLHHVARCTKLALDSACRLLQSEINEISGCCRVEATGGDGKHSSGNWGDGGSGKSGSDVSKCNSGNSPDTTKRGSYEEPVWKLALRVLPESWGHAAASVFQNRLDCAADRAKLAAKTDRIIADMRKCVETYEEERHARGSLQTVDKTRTDTSRSTVHTQSSAEDSREAKETHSMGPDSSTVSDTLNKLVNGPDASGPIRKSSGKSGSEAKRKAFKQATKHADVTVPANQGKRVQQRKTTSVTTDNPRSQREGPRKMSVTCSQSYKSFVRFNHFSAGTATSIQRERLNQQRYGSIIYNRPRSRYVDLGFYAKRRSRASSDFSSSCGVKRTSLTDLQANEPEVASNQQQEQLSDELDQNEATRLWQTLASYLIQQRFSAVAEEATIGTLEGLLDFVMSQFAARHPGDLPCALPPAVLRLLLTLMEALSAGGGCSLLLRGQRTPGLRTAVQLACFVTQQTLVDLRSLPHVAERADAESALCRCVLMSMFGEQRQCLYVTESSSALQLVHAVVTARLPLQLLASDTWQAEAKRLGFERRLRHLERRGTLLTVAGDTIARRLHIVMSCSLTGDAGGSHFPELRLQARWPSFFRTTVLSLPGWSAADYATVVHRYLGSLDGRLAARALAELLVSLHLDACGQLQKKRLNSLSLLYQLCEAFVVGFGMLHTNVTRRIEQLVQQVSQLEAVRRAYDELCDQVAVMRHTAAALHEMWIVKKRCLVEADAHVQREQATETEQVQLHTSIIYRLHQRHKSLDQLQPEVDQMHTRMHAVTVATNFEGTFSELCQFETPPEAVLVICQCLCVLLDRETNWETVAPLLKMAGLPRVCRLISMDIVTEQQLEQLQKLLTVSDKERLRQQLQGQCESAIELLDWLLQLIAAGRCYQQLASAAAESSRLSKECFRLQAALVASGQQVERLQQMRRAAAEQLQQATEQLQMTHRQLRHASERRDWLSRLEAALWRSDAAPDGSRAVGPRLTEELSQLAEVNHHLPAAAAVLAAATTFWASGGAETCRLQHWLQLLACHQPEHCTCPEVRLTQPAPPPSQLGDLPEHLRGKLMKCPPWFSRHPLTTDAAEFARRCLMPAWCSKLSESSATEDGSLLSLLMLSVALHRPSTRLIVVSDPETNLKLYLRHLGHQLPTVSEEELLRQAHCRAPNGSERVGGDDAWESVWHGSKYHQAAVSNLLSGTSEASKGDTVPGRNQTLGEMSKESQQEALERTSMTSVEDVATVNTDILLSYVFAVDRRLVVRYLGDASLLAERLLRACRGQQHLIAHLNLSPGNETVSALIEPLVVSLIRPQVHRDQRTYKDDLRYWEARRSAAQRRLLTQWPELLRLLDQLLRAGRCPLPLPERADPQSIDPPGSIATMTALAAPLPQRPMRERPTLTPSVVRLRDGQTDGGSLADVSLAAAAPAEPNAGPEPCDTAQLLAELKRRRRQSRASLEMAHTWRGRLERLKRSQRLMGHRESRAPRSTADAQLSQFASEAQPQQNLDTIGLMKPSFKNLDVKGTYKAVNLTESVVSCVASQHSPKVSFQIDRASRQVQDEGEAELKPGPTKDMSTDNGDVHLTNPKAFVITGAGTNRKPDSTDDGSLENVTPRRRRRRLGFNVGSLVPDSSCNVGSLLPGGRRERLRSSSGHRDSKVRQRRRSRRRSSAPTPRDRTPPPPFAMAIDDGVAIAEVSPAAGARRRLASLRQCEASLLQMTAEVDTLDGSVANCRYQLAQLVTQRTPLQPVVAFFSGLYMAVSALQLQSRGLSLDRFADWLTLSLRARAAAKLEDRKSADYFRMLGAADVVPRLLERIPAGQRCGYLLLAALLAADWTDAARLRLLVHGPPSCDGWHRRWLSACPPWAAERQWLALGALSRQVPTVRRLVAALRTGDDAGWQARLAAGPDVLDRGGLAAGDWALVWRALQPDAMPAVVMQLINCVLGPASLQALEELGSGPGGAQQALSLVSRCVPTVIYPGMTSRLVEKLAIYVRQLLKLLRRERQAETTEASDPPPDEQCAWMRYLIEERWLAHARVCRVHDELVEVRRLLSARLAPSNRLEALVTCLAERSAPTQWVPADSTAPARLPQLLRYLLASGRHVQQLAERAPQLWTQPSEPLPLRLGQLPRPAECLPSLREAAAARLRLPAQRVAITVVDEQHPAPARSVHVRLDMRHVHSAQRAQLTGLCVGWRRRPRTEHVLLALCPVSELCWGTEAGPEPAKETESSSQPPPGRRERACSVVDPTMKKFVDQVRLSVG